MLDAVRAQALYSTFSGAKLPSGAAALLTFSAKDILTRPLHADAKVPRSCQRALQAGAELRVLISPGRREFLIPLICDVD